MFYFSNFANEKLERGEKELCWRAVKELLLINASFRLAGQMDTPSTAS